MQFKSKMIVSYNNTTGQIDFVGEQYVTFIPENSKASLLIYRQNWKDVTVLKPSTTPWFSPLSMLSLLGNQMKNQMSVLEVTNSSAIAKVSFETELQEVGVAYNSNPDTFYVFKCDNVEDVQKQVETAESVGKLIAQLKKNSVLVPVDQLTAW